VPELINNDWVQALAYLVDLSAYLNKLNLKLQDENKQLYKSCQNIPGQTSPLGNSTKELQHIPFCYIV
jgi:hypothetical protein